MSLWVCYPSCFIYKPWPTLSPLLGFIMRLDFCIIPSCTAGGRQYLKHYSAIYIATVLPSCLTKSTLDSLLPPSEQDSLPKGTIDTRTSTERLQHSSIILWTHCQSYPQAILWRQHRCARPTATLSDPCWRFRPFPRRSCRCCGREQSVVMDDTNEIRV